MNRSQAVGNRDKAARLIAEWKVNAVQGRYREIGDWYAALTRFPAALFDADGYILFETEDEYLKCEKIQHGKQISIRPGGISTLPGYVVMVHADQVPDPVRSEEATWAAEGDPRLAVHIRYERDQAIVRRKKELAGSLECEVCGFEFGATYGTPASNMCEVHHLLPLGGGSEARVTLVEDLAILCANCHRVVHLKETPYTLDEVRRMLAETRGGR